MHKFNSILVGLDLGARGDTLSNGSRLAVAEAVALAKANGAGLTLIHSTAADEHLEVDSGGYVHREGGVSKAGRAALDKVFAECREQGVETAMDLTEEKAWLGIIRAVLRGGHDLVVVGKRTEHSDRTHQPGSVCQKLLRKCPCPVWAVKPGVSPIPKNVVVGTDRSACGDHALHTAADLSRVWGSQLHVVVALQLPLEAQIGGERDRYEAEHIEQNRQELTTICSEAKVAAENTHLHVAIASPTAAIEAAVERFDPDLLVMGSVGRGGFVGLLMGNTAERLLDRVDCSLLVIKPEDFVCPVDA